MRLALHDWVIAWDRRDGRAWLGGRAVDERISALDGRLDEVRVGLAAQPRSGPATTAQARDTAGLELRSGLDRAAYEAGVESIRDSIEHYRMAVRSADRPKQAEEGAKRRGEGAAEQSLSVTVSVGIASPSEKHGTPQQVILAADEALYRAKKAGRNRVSR